MSHHIILEYTRLLLNQNTIWQSPGHIAICTIDMNSPLVMEGSVGQKLAETGMYAPIS